MYLLKLDMNFLYDISDLCIVVDKCISSNTASYALFPLITKRRNILMFCIRKIWGKNDIISTIFIHFILKKNYMINLAQSKFNLYITWLPKVAIVVILSKISKVVFFIAKVVRLEYHFIYGEQTMRYYGNGKARIF